MSHIRIISERGTVLVSDHVPGDVSVKRVGRSIHVTGPLVQPFSIAGEGILGGKLDVNTTVQKGQRRRIRWVLSRSIRLSRGQ